MSASPFRLSEQVREALARKQAVVALETSVVAQGLPYPQNLEAARACEQAVRASGATPAPTAVLDGEVWLGLSETQLQRLAEPSRSPLWKLASRDLPMALASKATGGTTVSATCCLAAAAGIAVFATGGIGGVHRGVAEHLDISQDLWALSRYPVAVVCAGAKSILDLPKTLEALEALGVPVLGVRTGEFPAFYSVRSGLALEHRVEDAAGGAAAMHARFEVLEQGGMLFALPPPAETALAGAEVEDEVRRALAAASAQGVQGKALTPFMLAHMSRATGGRSLQANLALLANNACFAGELAVAYAALRNG